VKEIRNVQVTGGGTYIVSLPKEWVKSNNIKPQDKIVILEQEDSSLLIYVWKDIKKREEKIASLNLEEYEDFDSIIRECIACYLVGYNKINLKFGKKTLDYKEKIKEILRNRLVGIEFLEENIDSLYVQVFSIAEMYLSKAFSRLYSLVYLMLENLSYALKENMEIFNKISKLDDEVDRIYNLINRQINLAINNVYLMPDLGITKRSELIGYRLNGKTLERIADHIENISNELSNSYSSFDKSIIKTLHALSETSKNLLKNAYNSYVEKDKIIANNTIKECFDKIKDLLQIEKSIFNYKLNQEAIISLRVILDSFKRIIEYSIDICEFAIDKSVEEKI